MGTILLLMAFMLGGSGVLASARKLFLFAGWQMLGADAALMFFFFTVVVFADKLLGDAPILCQH